MKDVQATGEAFNPRKRTSSTSKHDIFWTIFFSFYFCESFLPCRDPEPNSQCDPDPADQNQCWSVLKYCCEVSPWRCVISRWFVLEPESGRLEYYLLEVRKQTRICKKRAWRLLCHTYKLKLLSLFDRVFIYLWNFLYGQIPCVHYIESLGC